MSNTNLAVVRTQISNICDAAVKLVQTDISQTGANEEINKLKGKVNVFETSLYGTRHMFIAEFNKDHNLETFFEQREGKTRFKKIAADSFANACKKNIEEKKKIV